MAGTAYPIPPGRGRWRRTLHRRAFTATDWPAAILGQLDSARSCQLVQAWDTPAQLTFTMDGRDPAAALIAELQCDVMAWRWDDQPGAIYSSEVGADVPVFRGVVAQAEDEVSEDAHTVNFTAHDYVSMLGRRYTPQALTYTQTDQDTLAANFAALAVNPLAADGQSFAPGGYLPLVTVPVNGDGTQRAAPSGQLRDRTYTAGTPLDQMLDDLAKVLGGFDYDLITAQQAADIGLRYSTTMNYRDVIRIFYPAQGVQRLDCPLEYGSTVSSLTRSVDSGDYANYVRVFGSAPTGAADGTPPLFSEAWDSNANNTNVVPVGLWEEIDNASDVTVQATLDQKARGDLALAGITYTETSTVVTPSYTLAMRPGAYRWGAPNMGDTCPLIVRSGRLDVVSSIRVLGLTYAIGDDGQEDVTLTVGRPARPLSALFTQADRDTDALTRR